MTLGSWTNQQRFAKKKGKVSAERIKKLDKLGFQWVLHATEPPVEAPIETTLETMTTLDTMDSMEPPTEQIIE